MSADVSFLVSKNSVTVNYSTTNSDGKAYHTKTIHSTDPEYDEILYAIKEDRLEDIPELLEAQGKKFASFSDGNIEIKDGVLYIDGEEAPSDLADRISAHADEGLPYQPLVNFWRRLRKNPSFRAVQGLFRFLESNHHPITDDGCFLAYKGVRSDYTDSATGTFDNSIGAVVKMPRNKVDDDPDRTCSHGLHVASYDYAHTQYGYGSYRCGITLIVKVDPEHVVAVPRDYNDQKMRVCEHIVLGLCDKGELKSYQASEEEPYKPIHSDPLDDPYNDYLENDDDYDDDYEDEEYNDW